MELIPILGAILKVVEFVFLCILISTPFTIIKLLRGISEKIDRTNYFLVKLTKQVGGQS